MRRANSEATPCPTISVFAYCRILRYARAVGTQVRALIIFNDIRGFTAWSDHHEVASNLGSFIEGFDALLTEHFPSDHFKVKSTGDGAMIVKVLDPQLRGDGIRDLLADALQRILAFETGFDSHCVDFSEVVGQPAQLRVGWGITRGQAWQVGEDFFSANVNKASRICDAARPSGIAVSKPDFPHLPSIEPLAFEEQVRVLPGLDPEPIWLTTAAARNHLPRERLKETPEVHVTGTCIDPSQSPLRILMARRIGKRNLYPKKWEGCGGQLRANESFTEGVRRHFEAEMKMEVEPLEDPHCFYQINEANQPFIPGIRFLCIPRSYPPEPKPSPESHTEFRWVTEDELKALPAKEFIQGWREEVLRLLEQYKKSRSP